MGRLPSRRSSFKGRGRVWVAPPLCPSSLLKGAEPLGPQSEAGGGCLIWPLPGAGGTAHHVHYHQGAQQAGRAAPHRCAGRAGRRDVLTAGSRRLTAPSAPARRSHTAAGGEQAWRAPEMPAAGAADRATRAPAALGTDSGTLAPCKVSQAAGHEGDLGEG